jgi:hypothetical protein
VADESGEFVTARAGRRCEYCQKKLGDCPRVFSTIVEQILEGKEPESMSLRQLRKGIPLLWSEQGNISEA